MPKYGTSIRFDPSQNEMLKIRAAELNVKVSEYVRQLVERDNVGRYKKPSLDQYSLWKENRAIVTLSDTQVALLEAIKKEYDKAEINQHTPKSLTKFCDKYGFDKKLAKTDLENLVKRGLLNNGTPEDNSDYVWTREGIIILPEYVFKASRVCQILSGNISSLLHVMLGDYWESVQYIQDSLKVSRKKAHEAFRLVLGEHVLFLNWLRDHAYDMTGIPHPDNVIYHRKQMMHFLMSYCLMVKDPDFLDVDDDFRDLCRDLTKMIANYLKR